MSRMVTRWAYIVALLGALCAGPASAQLIARNPSGDPFFLTADTPWTPNDLVCATGPNAITVGGACNSLGGSLTTTNGATRQVTSLEELVSTVTSATSVSTSATVPAGSIIESCLAYTKVAVSTSGGGGYQVGIAGAANIWAIAVAGTLGSTNLLDQQWTAPNRVYADTAIVLTPVSGTFSNNTGRVRVSCFYVTFGAATQ